MSRCQQSKAQLTLKGCQISTECGNSWALQQHISTPLMLDCIGIFIFGISMFSLACPSSSEAVTQKKLVVALAFRPGVLLRVAGQGVCMKFQPGSSTVLNPLSSLHCYTFRYTVMKQIAFTFTTNSLYYNFDTQVCEAAIPWLSERVIALLIKLTYFLIGY